jgi:uncharacterized SAM-binding protein YcdF (DUF218 family)
MFLLKKIISSFVMPVPACLLLALLGLFLLWFTRKQKTGKVFVTIAIGLLTLLSYGTVSDMLTKPLENIYPPFENFESSKDVKWIVVLSGGSGVDKALPLSTYLSEASLKRVSEGVFIHKRLPEAKLIMTGRSGFEGITPVAEVMGKGRRSVVGSQGSGKAGAAIHEYLGMGSGSGKHYCRKKGRRHQGSCDLCEGDCGKG